MSCQSKNRNEIKIDTNITIKIKSIAIWPDPERKIVKLTLETIEANVIDKIKNSDTPTTHSKTKQKKR